MTVDLYYHFDEMSYIYIFGGSYTYDDDLYISQINRYDLFENTKI